MSVSSSDFWAYCPTTPGFYPTWLRCWLPSLYRQLLRQRERWRWSKEQETAFSWKAKELLVSSQLLVDFDPELEIRLACDASDYGIGAVLSHRFPDGSEKPVSFMPRTLNEASTLRLRRRV